MKCIFIYNPNSGKGRILNNLDYIEREFRKAYDEVVMRGTKSREDLFKVVEEACDKFDIIAFSGGDGTFNDVASVVCRQEKRPILAYIPSGTVNDLGRSLKIPRNIKRAVKLITKGKVVYHDAGLINDKYFVYVAATGTFTSISYKTKQSVKKILGKLAYILDSIDDVVSVTMVNAKIICHDTGEEIKGEFPLVLALNSRTVGGFAINRKGHLNDGIFDIVCIKKIYKFHRWFSIFNIFNLFILGFTRRKTETPYYKMTRSSDFEIQTSDDHIWTLDGEEGMTGNVRIKNLHNHLKIIVPTKHNKPKARHLLPNDREIE